MITNSTGDRLYCQHEPWQCHNCARSKNISRGRIVEANCILKTTPPPHFGLDVVYKMGGGPINGTLQYYDLLECTLCDNDLMDMPSQIFNLDETGMPLDPSPPLIVARCGQKHPSALGSKDKFQITVLSCCSAAGYALPPFVIFDRQKLNPKLTIREVPGTVYGLSKKGWIDGELFDLWFSHFLAHAPPMRPLLLLMDGHLSHYQPGVIRSAANEKVIMFCLPPHTTHLTQPLDKGCFGPLKMHWQQECWSYITAHPDRNITRYQFSKLFGQAWMKGMTMQNIVARFHTMGVYPFNRSALSPSKSSNLLKTLACVSFHSIVLLVNQAYLQQQ